MVKYLSMDGVDDELFVPSITYTKVVFDVSIDVPPTNRTYLIRNITHPYECVEFKDGSSNIFPNVFSADVNGTSLGYNASYVEYDSKRVIMTTTLAEPATNTFYICSNGWGTGSLKADIWDVKFYNGETLVAHYDMSTGTVLDQSGNGNHATLTGGTWVEEAPPPKYYLSMDGVDDYLVAPTLTFNKIVLELSSDNKLPYARYVSWNGTYYYLETQSDGLTENYQDYAMEIYKDGVYVNKRTTFIDSTKAVFDISYTDRNGYGYSFPITFGKLSGSNERYANANYYDIKIYNDTTLLAHYDMSTGTVDDQSGNGNHATLTGGTWVEEAPPPKYYLSMDGVDDYIKTPTVPFTRVVIDASFVPKLNNRYMTWAGSHRGEWLRDGTNPLDKVMNLGMESVYKNGELQENNTTYIVENERAVYEVRAGLELNTEIFLFTIVEFNRPYTEGNIYDVKVYNGTTLVAHYDMSTGTVEDQSGNGNHAILTGGTWVEEIGTTDPGTGSEVLFEGTALSNSQIQSLLNRSRRILGNPSMNLTEANASGLSRSFEVMGSSTHITEASANVVRRLRPIAGQSLTTSEVESFIQSMKGISGLSSTSSEALAELYLQLYSEVSFMGQSLNRSESVINLMKAIPFVVGVATTSEATAGRLLRTVFYQAGIQSISESTVNKVLRMIPLSGTSFIESHADLELLRRLLPITGESRNTTEAVSDFVRRMTLNGQSIGNTAGTAQLLIEALQEVGLQGISTSTSEAQTILNKLMGMNGESNNESSVNAQLLKRFSFEGESANSTDMGAILKLTIGLNGQSSNLTESEALMSAVSSIILSGLSTTASSIAVTPLHLDKGITSHVNIESDALMSFQNSLSFEGDSLTEAIHEAILGLDFTMPSGSAQVESTTTATIIVEIIDRYPTTDLKGLYLVEVSLKGQRVVDVNLKGVLQ